MIAEQENRTTSEQDSHAGMIADDFDRSMTRSDGAYYLSNGLYVLQNHATRDAPAISIKASNRLLQKCQELMAVWPPLMTDLLRAKAAEAGLEGAAALVRYWGEPPGVRVHWATNRIYDANLDVRWLRNECHNAALMQERAERRRRRVAAADANGRERLL